MFFGSSAPPADSAQLQGGRVEVNHLHSVIQQGLDGQRATTIREGHKLGGDASILLLEAGDAVGALGKLRAAPSFRFAQREARSSRLRRPYFWAVCAVTTSESLILRLGGVQGADFSPGATRGEGAEGGG